VIRIRHRLDGGHVYARFFVGPDTDHLANAGSLTLREEEWDDFRDSLGRAEFVEDEEAEI
jgi:hypothetical protein